MRRVGEWGASDDTVYVVWCHPEHYKQVADAWNAVDDDDSTLNAMDGVKAAGGILIPIEKKRFAVQT